MSKDNIQDFLEGLLPNTRLLIQPKIDGRAIAIKYVNDKLGKAISRKGCVVIEKIKTIKSILKAINIRSSFVIRGELFTQQEVPSYTQRIASEFLRSRYYHPSPKFCFCAFQIINFNFN
tara:strand:- start:190 stop:546 length:357 start_codon:yes stop_codon:yes gene_type:complete